MLPLQRCRSSKREIGGQLTRVATKNLTWDACVWLISITTLHNSVSWRKIVFLAVAVRAQTLPGVND